MSQAAAFLERLMIGGKARLAGGSAFVEFERRFNELAAANPKARPVLNKLLDSLIFHEASTPLSDGRWLDAAAAARLLGVGRGDHGPRSSSQYRDAMILARALAEGKTLSTADGGLYGPIEALAGKGPRRLDAATTVTVQRLSDGRLEVRVDGPNGGARGFVRPQQPVPPARSPGPMARDPYQPPPGRLDRLRALWRKPVIRQPRAADPPPSSWRRSSLS